MRETFFRCLMESCTIEPGYIGILPVIGRTYLSRARANKQTKPTIDDEPDNVETLRKSTLDTDLSPDMSPGLQG